MQRLRGGDAQLLYNESASSPFVTLKTMIYEPVDGNSVTADEFREFIARGVTHWLDSGLGLRIVRVPLDLHHPVWVEDNTFCINNHVHHISLPAPGNADKLSEFISTIMSQPLPPNRPLWDSWIVEGLEGGRLAWVCKMHHVLADGLMSAEHIINIHNAAATDATYVSPSTRVYNDYPDVPSPIALFWSALVDLAKTYTIEFPEYRREYKQARIKNKAKRPRNSTKTAYGPFMAPFTMLNKPGGAYLTYRYSQFSLSDFKTLSRQLDCTINTLVLAICSEALRNYIRDYEPLPETPLVIIMPVSNRRDETHTQFLNTEIQNNSVSLAYVPLDLNIVDFYERLEAIKRGAQDAMKEIDYTKGERIENFADFMPGSFFRVLNWVFAQRQKRKQNPLSNMSISNVPGPRDELFACGGKLKMTELLSCGNLGDITSLGITVWSYVDTICFSCFFRNGVMPEPASFSRYLETAYDTIKREND